MLGFAFLGLIGFGLIFDLVSDDDDDQGDDQDSAQSESDGETITGPDTQVVGGGSNIFGAGDDDVAGGAANTSIISGGGDDLVSGGAGDDFLRGETGDDLILGQSGDDFIRGGSGNDAIVGGEGNDTLRGDTGEDFIVGVDILDEAAILEVARNGASGEFTRLFDFLNFEGESGEADTLNGGIDDDILFVGGNDEATTGTGSDIVSTGFWIEDGDFVTVTDFEQGTDALVYNYDETGSEPTVSFAENDADDAQVLINDKVVLELTDIDFRTLSLNDVLLIAVPVR